MCLVINPFRNFFGPDTTKDRYFIISKGEKMKLFAFAILLLGSQSLFAQYNNDCTYRLVDEYRREVARFTEYGCGNAIAKCNREKDYQIYNNLIRSGYCEQIYNSGPNPYPNPNPGPGNYQCEVTLENSYGQILRTFYGYSCGSAQASCEQERIRMETPYQSLACRIRNGNPNPYPNPNPNPYPYPSQFSCSFELKDVRNGMIVNRFNNYSSTERQACEISYNQCEADARIRNQYSNGIRNFVCQKGFSNNGGGYPNGQYVTRSCNVKIISIRGQLLDTTQATATGYDNYSVQNQACAQAETQCREIIRTRSMHGPQSAYYNARCERQY
jgi:hypothetical protein